MVTAVLRTKLFVPPQRSRSVARARLIDRLELGRRAGHTLTLVCAPAGFGKTALLSEWVAEITRLDPGAAIAWVSLDQGDNDPARFVRYLAGALRTQLDGAEPGTPQAVLGSVIDEVAGRSSSTLLVLDDFERIDGGAVRDLVVHLLEHRPANLHLVIASRSDPMLPLSRLRAGGTLTELRAADLRFTPEETTQFLNRVMGLGLALPDVAALQTRTEGWVAGLQLAALSVRERADATGVIAAFTGSNRFVVDYLGEEVLQRQSARVRSFLLLTAFLDRMSAPLCDAVTGRTDAAEMLDLLERENLFLVPLDDDRRWYRYHHLFADVLRARSRHEDHDRVAELLRRASEWHERNDLLEEAIDYALAAKDFARAARLIETALPEMRRRRQDTTLIAWLKVLPDDTARRMPVLRTFSAWALFAAGDLAGADLRFGEVETSLRSTEGHDSLDGAELVKLPVTIAAYRAAIAQARGDITATKAHARRAIELSPPEDHLGRGTGGGLLALALWADGDVVAAVPTFRDAMSSLELAGHITDAISATVVLADMLAVEGRRVAVAEAFERAAKLATEHGSGWTIDLHPGMAELLRDANDLVGAHTRLTAAPPVGAHDGVPENRYRWFVAMSRLREAEGDLAAAADLLEDAERLYLRGYFPDTRPIGAMRARIWIKQGRLADAAAWAVEQHIAAGDGDGREYLREFEHITLARLLIARFRSNGDPADIDSASGLLDRLHTAAETAGRGGSVNELLVLQSLALEGQGRLLDAMAPLRTVLERARAEGYVRLFTDEGDPMAALLDEAGRRAILPEYVRLLRRTFPATGPVSMRISESLSDRELAVLRLLTTELTGPQIADELFISVNTLRTHTRHIFDKLGVNGRPAAVRRARDQGLI